MVVNRAYGAEQSSLACCYSESAHVSAKSARVRVASHRRTGLWAIDRSCDNTVAAVTQKRTASAQRSKNCALSFVRLPSVAPELAVGKDVLIFGRVPGDTGRDAAGDLIRRCIRIQTRVCDRGACRLIEGGGAQEDGTLEHGAGDEVVHDRNGGRST